MERWDAILQVLGFTPAGEVYKIRRLCGTCFQGERFEISIDYLPALGEKTVQESGFDFTAGSRGDWGTDSRGWFLEIETQADETEKERSVEILLQFAATLPLGAGERRGYLELLLETENPQRKTCENAPDTPQKSAG